MKEIIVYTRQGKDIGEFDGEVFRQRVKASVHLLKRMDAWGIDALLLDDVLVPAKALIEITDTQNRIRYSISAEDARVVGATFQFDGLEDFGKQVFVPRSAFAQKTV